jgi:8-oxo-dGTP pyrophosphatase MutT (NUDIX family)
VSAGGEAPRRQPVRPRDAASLILHRRAGRGHEILMGRRPRGARFMPGVYVFPGGAVEREDRRVHVASALSKHLPGLLKVGESPARARALAVSAVRETYEETGLMLAAPGDPGLPAHPIWALWSEAGLAPDLAALELTGRAITPTRLPIRFHARFFIADGSRVTGRIAGDGELEDVGWVHLHEAHALPIADVQAFFIEHLQAVLGRGRDPHGRPVFTHRRGTRHVRYG